MVRLDRKKVVDEGLELFFTGFFLRVASPDLGEDERADDRLRVYILFIQHFPLAHNKTMKKVTHVSSCLPFD